MRRRAHIVGATSVVVCLAAIAMGVRSTVRGDQLNWGGMNHELIVRSVGGMVVVRWVDAPNIGELRSVRQPFYVSQFRDDFNTQFTLGNPWTRLGFWWQHEPAFWGNFAGTATWVAVPYWFIILVSGVPASRWARALWRNRAAVRWRAEGRCTRCGYDLRATPGRCPECGSEMERAADGIG